MKIKLFSILAIFAVLVGLVGFTTTAQATAYGKSFTTSITYQNIGTGPATIHIDFYANGSSTAIPFDLPQLPALAGSSLFVAAVSSIGSGFSGSAVMSSDQPLAVTIVQVPGTGTGLASRPLTNGMSAGATSVSIPTVLKSTFDFTSVFSVQNAGSTAADVTVNFIPFGGGSTVTETVSGLPAGSGKTFDLGTMSNLGATFNGSVQITSANPVVATDIEYGLGATNNKAYGFEGTTGGAAKVYMPSAFCKNGPTVIGSSYAVQNVNASGDVSVVVAYTGGGNTYTEPAVTIAAGAKDSFPGCGKSGSLVPAGFIGSATITATGGNIVAIGKVFDNTLGTAFVGFADAPSKVAVPYVRYANLTNWDSGALQRTFIAIQNIGSADIPAGQVTVKYYDKFGVQAGTTHTLGALAVGAKLSSNATQAGLAQFGVYPDNTYGGSAVVEGPAGSKLAVVARVQTNIGGGLTAGEDYNGIPMP